MARPFYSAPVKHRPDFPLLPGQVRLPPPHVLTGPPPPPPPPGLQPPGFTSDKPWMTPHLVAEIRRRNFLQNRAARSPAEQDRATAEQQRQLVNRLVNDAKERFCLAHPERTDEILASDRRSRPFHCGSCDRSYSTQQQLDEHCREHVRCGLDDCPFTAHPRVVEKHVTMQHQTGMAKVIMALNTPEAIARWRDQRRANFCRPETAARRQAEREERATRGIRLSAAGGRFPPAQERSGRGRGRAGRGAGQWRGRGRGSRPRPAEPQPLLSDSDEETPRGLPSFAGILTESVALGGGRSDGESEAGSDAGEDGVDALQSAVGSVGCSVGSVGCSVGSVGCSVVIQAGTQDGEMDCRSSVPAESGPFAGKSEPCPSENPMEAEGSAETEPIKATAESDPHPRGGGGEAGKAAAHSADPDIASTASEAGELCTTPASTDCPPVTSSASRRATPAESGPDTGGGRGRGGRGGRWRGRGRRGAGAEQPPRKRRRPLTLLEKMLAPDIRRERNIILQCVRHVVNEDFFSGQPLGRAAPRALAAAGPEAARQTDGGPQPAEVSPAPQQEAVVPAGGAADGGTVPDRAAVRQSEAGSSPNQPVPRLLGGAYDSDAITDSD